jgi:SAM-dependent methyltransferase
MNRLKNRLSRILYGPIEHILRYVERDLMTRSAILDSIPKYENRGGGLGTTTYAEWCHTIGLMQTLIFENLPQRPVRMLDVGCGVGRLYLAAKTYLTEIDSYVGLDVGASFIEICRRQYKAPNVSFVHTDSNNPYYARDAVERRQPWPMADHSFNLITALSVWTHLNEDDWRFYLGEVARVLSPGGRAIISFFILPNKSSRISSVYLQPENKFVFDTSAYGSTHWTYPHWAEVPEAAIGIDDTAFEREVAAAGLRVIKAYPGQWKDQPGFFFQDIMIFEHA